MTFFTYNLGCKVNSYECEAISSILLQKGYILDAKSPDIIIINTCSVTHVADRKSRQHIRKYRTLFPNAIIVAMGCYVQGNFNYVSKECGADIILGTSRRNEIPTLINEFLKTKKQIIAIDENPRKFDKFEELGITLCHENVRAYLKIQDGCDNFCSYCIVPYRRGKSRSRDFNTIIEEARSLIAKGYKEIIISGIHIGAYGKDIGHSFSELIEALLNIEGDFRIRISSIEESEIDDKLIELAMTNPKLAKHFHIPLQSGSDTILKLMKRKYDCEEYKNTCLKLRKYIPDFCIAADVIVGFPGETELEFEQTKNLCNECNFAWIHAFPFSPRPGTAAESMKPQVPERIKDERVRWLTDKAIEGKLKYIDYWKNKTLSAVVENPRSERLQNSSSSKLKQFKLHCVTDNFIHVEFISDKLIESGSRINIQITDTLEDSIRNGKETEASGKLF